MKKFSPSLQTFYDTNLSYSDLPADIIEITDEQHKKFITAINSGCIVDSELNISSAKPSQYHIYQNGEWIINSDVADQLKADEQAQIWEAIKQKRYDNVHSGCYIKSVDKWFHSDEPSRIQYLTLNTLPKLPSDLNWKTMNNTFVAMTDELLNELTMTLLQKEQADFANAERHRLAMLESENPLEYDFSDGWSATYA